MASSADLAGVASSADLAGVASSAVAEVVSSADLAGFVTPQVKFKMECGDGVLAPSDCGCICGDLLGWRPWSEVLGGPGWYSASGRYG